MTGDRRGPEEDTEVRGGGVLTMFLKVRNDAPPETLEELTPGLTLRFVSGSVGPKFDLQAEGRED